MKFGTQLLVAAVSTLAFATLSVPAMAGVVIGASSVTASGGLPSGYSSPTSLDNIINQSGLSANYVSGVTDFDSFVASTTAEYYCNGGCFPELGGVEGFPATITFNFGGFVTLESIAIWNQDGPASLVDFSIDGVAGIFTLPGSSQDSPQAGFAFSFAPITVQSLTLNILSNAGYSGGTLVNEVAFEGGAAVPEPTTWAMMVLGFGALGSALRAVRRRTAALA